MILMMKKLKMLVRRCLDIGNEPTFYCISPFCAFFAASSLYNESFHKYRTMIHTRTELMELGISKCIFVEKSRIPGKVIAIVQTCCNKGGGGSLCNLLDGPSAIPCRLLLYHITCLYGV